METAKADVKICKCENLKFEKCSVTYSVKAEIHVNSTSVRRKKSYIIGQKLMPQKLMHKLFTIFCFAIILKYNSINAQYSDSALIAALINNIDASQTKTNGEFYAGMFPSFRECGGAPRNYRPDNNIFFT